MAPDVTNVERSARRRTASVAACLAGISVVVSIGMAVDALAPDLRFRMRQSSMAASMPSPVMIEPAGRSMDLTGWDAEDAAYWRGLEIGDAFARLLAPDAGIDAIVVKGAGQHQLDEAPGWISSTDLPGAEGNCAISGHRVTHGHPFRKLDALKSGSFVDVYSPFRRYRYAVDRIMRVTPDRVDVVGHTVAPRLTLTTCDPPGRATLRLVVQARLVEVVRLPARDKRPRD